jgi:hypothetical protein
MRGVEAIFKVGYHVVPELCSPHHYVPEMYSRRQKLRNSGMAAIFSAVGLVWDKGHSL